MLTRIFNISYELKYNILFETVNKLETKLWYDIMARFKNRNR